MTLQDLPPEANLRLRAACSHPTRLGSRNELAKMDPEVQHTHDTNRRLESIAMLDCIATGCA